MAMATSWLVTPACWARVSSMRTSTFFVRAPQSSVTWAAPGVPRSLALTSSSSANSVSVSRPFRRMAIGGQAGSPIGSGRTVTFAGGKRSSTKDSISGITSRSMVARSPVWPRISA